jgi:hypothetical protein
MGAPLESFGSEGHHGIKFVATEHAWAASRAGHGTDASYYEVTAKYSRLLRAAMTEVNEPRDRRRSRLGEVSESALDRGHYLDFWTHVPQGRLKGVTFGLQGLARLTGIFVRHPKGLEFLVRNEVDLAIRSHQQRTVDTKMPMRPRFLLISHRTPPWALFVVIANFSTVNFFARLYGSVLEASTGHAGLT